MRWLGASTRPAARFGARLRPRGASPESSAPRARLLRPEGRSLPSSRWLAGVRPSTLRDVLRPAVLAVLVAVVVAGCGFKHEPTGALGSDLPDHHPRRGRSPDHARAPARQDPRARPGGGSDSQGTRRAGDAHPAGRARLAAARAASRPPDRPGRHDDRRGRLARTASRRADLRARRVPARAIEQGAAQLGLATGHPLAGRNLALALREAAPGARPPDREREAAERVRRPRLRVLDRARHAARDAGPRRRRAPRRSRRRPSPSRRSASPP